MLLWTQPLTRDIEISVGGVYDVLQNLDCNSEVGPDQMHPRVLKACAHQLAVPLTKIFNMSLTSGLLSVVWLQSVVIPLFKTKSRYDPGYYCPVSLTSACCKTMERDLVSELVYLELNGLLSERQFGFCKSRSAEDQLLLVYSEVAGLVDDDLVVDMVMLDFSKASDVVSHVVLLGKLQAISVSDVLLNWIWGFLSNRKMCVGVGGVSSNAKDVIVELHRVQYWVLFYS